MASSDFDIVNGVLKKYRGPGGDIVIPEGVTSIGDEAFKGCNSLTSVTWERTDAPRGFLSLFSRHQHGMTSIGKEAFRECSKLISVRIPDGVTSIGDMAFLSCRSLKSITIPKSVTSIGGWAFCGCDSLMSITLPEGLTNIKKSAFYGCSSLTHIVLPESLTSIEEAAFCGCRSLAHVTLPKNLTSIGDSAFLNCAKLTDVTIPENVTRIGKQAFEVCTGLTSLTLLCSNVGIGGRAFHRCSSLTSVTIPDSVTRIGHCAFYECNGLADENGLIIVKNRLYGYCGPGGAVTIPNCVTGIDDEAFVANKKINRIEMPPSVKSIGKDAFKGCRGLTVVELSEGLETIGKHAFCACSNLTAIELPKSVTSIGESAFSGCINLREITLGSGVSELPGWVFDGLPALRSVRIVGDGQTLDKNVFGAKLPEILIQQMKDLYPHFTDAGLKQYVLCREVWSRLDADLQVEIYIQRQRGGLASAYEKVMTADLYERIGEELARRVSLGDFAVDYALMVSFMKKYHTLVPKTLVKKLYDALKTNKGAAKQAKAVEKNEELMELINSDDDGEEAPAGLEGAFAAALRASALLKNDVPARLKDYYGLDLYQLPELYDKDGNPVEKLLTAFLLVAHGEYAGDYEHPGVRPELEPLLAELDEQKLQEALISLANSCLGISGNNKKMYLAYPICRYADAATMAELCRRAPKWRSGGSGNDAPPLRTFRKACIYSDTRAAMLLADKYHDLEDYAKLRGLDADTLRDTVLADLGLDADGKAVYDLGGKTVTVSLSDDLTLGIFDDAKGKAVKSIPKSGADEEKYKAASESFAELKKNVKRVAKNRVDTLFDAYLNGKSIAADKWQAAYLGNPVLNKVARLLVWEQDGRTFTLDRGGAIDAAGRPYALSAQPIRVAHPMEMTQTDIAAWQSYFTSHALKQPFAQVWEPVRRASEIKPDRYEGCEIPLFRFMNQEKRGIVLVDDGYDNGGIRFEMKNCSLEYVAKETGYHVSTWETKPTDLFVLGKFEVKEYTRSVNHIVAYLDQITTGERIKRDDLSAVEDLSGFTLAQITLFIDMAQEANATNVLVKLLDYKNEHFSDFNPMSEFTLEW